MSRERVCITNDVADLRSCVVKSVHGSTCDGFERKFDPETGQTKHTYRIEWNPETRKNDRWLIECPGCLPRGAERGLLCAAHVSKLEHALEGDGSRLVLVDLVTHMWSINSGGVRDDNTRVSSSFGSRWPLSESHIHANTVYSALAATAVAFANDLRIAEPRFSAAASILDGFATDLDVDIVGVLIRDLVVWLADNEEAAIKRRRSAEAVVRLVGVVQAAIGKFPLVDSDHRVPYVRCPGCSRMTLTWKPPLYYEDEVSVVCERCGHTEGQDWLEFYLETVKTDERRMR